MAANAALLPPHPTASSCRNGLHELPRREVSAGATGSFPRGFAMEGDPFGRDAKALHQASGQRYRHTKLPFRHLCPLEIADETDPDAAKIAIPIAARDMRAPNPAAPASGFDHLSQPDAVPVADQEVIGDLVHRVAGLPLPVNAPQQRHIAISTGAVMDDDVIPASWELRERGLNLLLPFYNADRGGGIRLLARLSPPDAFRAAETMDILKPAC